MFEDLIENEPEEKSAMTWCSYALDQAQCPYYEFDGNKDCDHYGCLTSYCYREYNENV